MGSGAAPTYGLTIWQPWASLIAEGWKQFEFRRYAAPRFVIGHRIAIHAGRRHWRSVEIAELTNDDRRLAGSTGLTHQAALDAATELLHRVERGEVVLPLGAVIATAVLGEPRRALDMFRGHIPPEEIDPAMWAWPLIAVERVEPIVPMRGAQGFWKCGLAA